MIDEPLSRGYQLTPYVRYGCRGAEQGPFLGLEGGLRHDLESDAVGFRIEEDAGPPALELRAHLRDFLLQGALALPVVGAFAQYEGLDHCAQRFGRELLVGNVQGNRQLRRDRVCVSSISISM